MSNKRGWPNEFAVFADVLSSVNRWYADTKNMSRICPTYMLAHDWIGLNDLPGYYERIKAEYDEHCKAKFYLDFEPSEYPRLNNYNVYQYSTDEKPGRIRWGGSITCAALQIAGQICNDIILMGCEFSDPYAHKRETMEEEICKLQSRGMGVMHVGFTNLKGPEIITIQQAQNLIGWR